MNDSNDQSSSFEALRGQLEGDLRPVRPWAAGRWMALFAVASMVAWAAILWAVLGWRADSEALGAPWLWGFSLVELAAGIALSIWVLREAVPGMSSSLAALVGGAAGAAILHAAVNWGTYLKSPIMVPAGRQWMYGIYCFRYEVFLGIPSLLFVLWLSHRGLTARSRRVGLIGGLAAGMAADAVWRLFCPYADPVHSLASHSLGILGIVALGGLATVLWDGWKARAWRSRRAV